MAMFPPTPECAPMKSSPFIAQWESTFQKKVREDMQEGFSTYPNQARWRLADTDTNIDHRRSLI
jgi:uncharacterized protein YijF (DUF1287 family)